MRAALLTKRHFLNIGIRDETKPEMLEYYVATVTFRPRTNDDAAVEPVDLAVPRDTPRLGGIGSVSVRELLEAQVPPGLSGSDVELRLSTWRREQAALRDAQDTQRRRWSSRLRSGGRALLQ